MTDLSSAGFLALVSGRRGHFALESGHDGAPWLDPDPPFGTAGRIAPRVHTSARRGEGGIDLDYFSIDWGLTMTLHARDSTGVEGTGRRGQLGRLTGAGHDIPAPTDSAATPP